MESGYEYVAIMQKMCLRSLEREGKLMLTDNIPYHIPVLAKVLGHKQETIEKAINVFNDLRLCTVMQDKSIYMNEIQKYRKY
jgi:predicted phage replisome organizer